MFCSDTLFFHVQAVLAAEQLQLLSDRIHGTIFPQIVPMFKTIFRDFYGIFLVGFHLADGTVGIVVVDHDGIDEGNKDASLMKL